MSSYDETASPDRDPLSPAPEEAPDTVQETAPEAAGMPQETSADTGKEAPAEPAQDTSVPQESQTRGFYRRCTVGVCPALNLTIHRQPFFLKRRY